MDIPKDDILEYALNNGIAEAAKKFSVTPEFVLKIVKEFKIDNGDYKPSITDNTMSGPEIERIKPKK